MVILRKRDQYPPPFAAISSVRTFAHTEYTVLMRDNDFRIRLLLIGILRGVRERKG
ncbi:hypothetical protein SAMN05444162_3497 [Paenibacillaceae bacterium GAS479]|nr:hypothetical protein SAMN05444162_3497 [Paenibacillaceae bacterium GAS479]